jgi:membrane fusion protein (multidrug efflux system)
VKLAVELGGMVMGGTVAWVGKKEGEKVAKDEPVIKLDTAIFQSQYDLANAKYKLSKLSLDRTKQLYESKNASKDQLDRAQAEYDANAAALENAAIMIKKCVIASPIDGMLERCTVSVGEYVGTGQQVGDVVRTDKLYAVVQVPEQDRQYVQPGMQTGLRFSNVKTHNPGGPFETLGVVRSVGDVGQDISRTYRTKVEFDNPGNLVKPGMVGTAVILRGQLDNVVFVEKDRIVSSEGTQLVYIARDGVACPRQVQLGITNGTLFYVAKGLEAGEQILKDPRGVSGGELIEIQTVDGVPVARDPIPSVWNPGKLVREMMNRAAKNEKNN